MGKRKWCRGAESNRRHEDFQSTALPTELPRHLAQVAGFQREGVFQHPQLYRSFMRYSELKGIRPGTVKFYEQKLGRFFQ